MTAQNPAIFLQAGSHPAEDVRRMLRAQSGAQKGVLEGFAVTQNGTPNMSVNVAEGSAWVPGTEAAYQGSYFVENRGTTNLAIAAANATNPRYDLIVAKVQDAAYSGATNAWSLAVVTGTPAASPAEPTVPANAIVLARVTVAAAVTSITNAAITDRRWTQTGQVVAGADNRVPWGVSTNRPSAATVGSTFYEFDTGRLLVADGSNWTVPKSMAGPYVCTSSTRPSAGIYEGLFIYETDTDRIYVYSGSAWVYVRGGQDPTYAHAYRSTAFNLTSGATITIPFNVEDADYGNNYNTGTGLYTCPTAGVYRVAGRYSTQLAATNERFTIGVVKNGSEYVRGDDQAIGGSGWMGVSISAEIPCNAGDTLGIAGIQVTGTSRGIETASAPRTTWGTFRRVSG